MKLPEEQFFSSVGRISVSFSYKQISFNKDAIRKFPNIKFVELLIHPSSKLLAIRPCSSETKNKVQWSRLKDGQLIPKPISGAAFLPTLYEIFKWDKKCKYRILGVATKKTMKMSYFQHGRYRNTNTDKYQRRIRPQQ